MKFLQANLVTALLAATTFAAPSAAARLKHLREGEGDLKKFEKKSTDELLEGVRRLADDIDIDFANFANVDVASMMAEINSAPEIARLRKKKRKDSPQCHIGLDYLERKYPEGPYTPPEPKVICCDMPQIYYDKLQNALNDILPEILFYLIEVDGCVPATTRPACYSTGTQITYWQFQSTEEPDGETETDYPVCEGAVISPGEYFTNDATITNFDAFLAGYLDSPVLVLIADLHLHCPTQDCTFNGGQYQILSYASFPELNIEVNDISDLTIEGFTFTGTMTSAPNNVYEQKTGSIFLGAPGTNVSIKNNVFKKISNPIEDGIDCNFLSDFPKGYSAVFVGPTGGSFELTIENNVFENIDTGTYPVYANNPKECNFCYEETKTKNPTSSLIMNIGKEVNLVGNNFKNIVAQDLYLASAESESTTTGNIFSKNSVYALFTLVKPNQADVSFDGNEGECKQNYIGGKYCPVRFVGTGYFPMIYTGSPYENCDGSKFCYTENRVSRMNSFWIDEPVCYSFEE